MKTELAFDCPWCSGPMTLAAEGSATEATVACATCSIVVELAPDPTADPVALAA